MFYSVAARRKSLSFNRRLGTPANGECGRGATLRARRSRRAGHWTLRITPFETARARGAEGS